MAKSNPKVESRSPRLFFANITQTNFGDFLNEIGMFSFSL